MSDEQKKEGAFITSLKRNNKEIKHDRAQTIFEDVELKYRREIEDLQIETRMLVKQQEAMLDMSPENTLSFIKVSDFNPDEYIRKDLDLGIQIRNKEIKLEIAKKRYAYLFGGE